MTELTASIVVSRRTVVGGAVAAVVGGIVGFVVARNSAAANSSSPAAANSYGYSPSKQKTSRQLVALAKVPVGGGVIVHNVVVTRDSGGTVHAFSAICTHQGCTVSSVHDGVITCPCHGSRFNADTGAVVAGPAPRPLPSVPVKVNGGVVYAQ